MKRNLLSLALAASAVSLFAASSAFAGTLSIGATPVPHAEILEHIEPALKASGVELKIVEFNDYVQPNLAVAENELDANFFQHQPYLDTFNKDHNLDLVSVAGIHIEPMGIYPGQSKDLANVKDGALIAIPNDPTNGGRALLLLQKAGLIKLSDPDNVAATVLDISENPKKLEFRELEAAQLPRSLPDVDFAVINTNFAMPAGLNPLKDALLIEDADSPYVNIVVASQESKDNPDLKILIEQLKSADTAKFITEKYNGAVVPVAGNQAR